ncbi:MAG TPA: hypothetical protein VF094_00635 [Gaiellaceae bacterium]
MIEIGYALSSEEHPPSELVRQAVAAEEAGFHFALISDHYHPWIDARVRARSSGRCSERSGRPRPR